MIFNRKCWVFSQISEANSQSQTSLSRSRSVSQAGGVFEGKSDVRVTEVVENISGNKVFLCLNYGGACFFH